MRNKHSVIRVIRVVERISVGLQKACSSKNPDMKSKMNDRFTQWKNAVTPIIKTAEKQLNAEHRFTAVSLMQKFRRVMKLNDDAFEYGEKQIQKTPVSGKRSVRGFAGKYG